MTVLLIHPPVAKPAEPPAGLAKLAGALKRHGVPYRLLDASLEGLLHLFRGGQTGETQGDNWTRRAFRQQADHLEALRTWPAYRSPDRYGRAVHDLSRVLRKTGTQSHIRVGLANYDDHILSPVRSADLLQAAEVPEANPFYPYFRTRLISLLEEELPQIVGFSVNYLSQVLCAFAMIGLLRKASPSLRIVLGGGLVTSWAKRLAGENPFAGLVDDVIAGPGEGPLLKMLGKTADHLESTPDYSALPLSGYLSPGIILPYAASRGCYWRRCSFCPERAEENPYQPVPVEQVMTDLKMLTRQTAPSLIHFLDNAMSPALLRALAKSGIGMPWYGFVRMTEDLADRDFCKQLKQSGCAMLKLGLESGSQDVLNGLQKGIDLETASRVLASLKASGIATYVYLLFGTPAETPEKAKETLDFVIRHGEEIGFLNPAIFNLPIAAADDLETRSFYAGDLSLYRDFVHPAGWDRPRVRHFLDREFKRQPAVAAILKNDPPVFTSNHAAFFITAPDGARGAISRRHLRGRP
jgi:hypothetical protein